jgi:hypothetical protein
MSKLIALKKSTEARKREAEKKATARIPDKIVTYNTIKF